MMGVLINELVVLNDDDFAKLSLAFTNLEKKSGVFIDPYADTRLSPDHAAILLSNIKSNKALMDMLKVSVSNSKWILVIGD